MALLTVLSACSTTTLRWRAGHSILSNFPRVQAGVLTFDGDGNLSNFGTSSAGGEISRRVATTGTYTLDSDCTGTLQVPGANWDVFVSRDGNNGTFIRYDDGTIAIRLFKRR